MHIWIKAKHDVVIAKIAFLLKIVHVVVIFIEDLNFTLLDQVQASNFLPILNESIAFLKNLALDIHHQFGDYS